jgi:hypothetical protein
MLMVLAGSAEYPGAPRCWMQASGTVLLTSRHPGVDSATRWPVTSGCVVPTYASTRYASGAVWCRRLTFTIGMASGLGVYGVAIHATSRRCVLAAIAG